MKYILIIYLFEDTNVDTFFYILSQTYKKLTVRMLFHSFLLEFFGILPFSVSSKRAQNYGLILILKFESPKLLTRSAKSTVALTESENPFLFQCQISYNSAFRSLVFYSCCALVLSVMVFCINFSSLLSILFIMVFCKQQVPI